MAANAVGLPEGFELEPQAQPQLGLPDGFVLERPNIGEDILKSGATGLEKAAISNLGATGDLRELAAHGADWIADKISPPTPQDLITRGEGMPQRAGEVFKAGLRHMPGMAGAMFSLPTSRETRQIVEDKTGPLYEPKTVAGEYAQTAGEFAPGALAGPGGVGRRLLTQVALPAISSETAGQLTKGTAAEPYARLAGAVAGPVAASTLRRAVSPPAISAERQAARAALEAEGVQTTAGQASGNQNLLNKEATAGTRAEEFTQQQIDQLTEAAIRRIGGTENNVHDAVQAARPRIGQQFDNSTQRMLVRHDPQFGNDILAVDQALVNEGLSDAQLNRIFAQRDNILRTFAPTVVGRNNTAVHEMTGTAFHNLIKTGGPLERATRDADANIAYYANRYRNALFDAAERTANRQGTRAGVGNRQALADFQEARRHWANMLALEDASSGAGATAANGRLTPAAVRRAATFQDKSDLARGRGDFNELARASNMLMTPLPNSGTPGRLWSRLPAQLIGGTIGGMLGTPMSPIGPGIGSAIGAIAGPAIQGRIVMSGPVQRYLSSGALPARPLSEHARRLLMNSMLTRPQLPAPLGMLDEQR